MRLIIFLIFLILCVIEYDLGKILKEISKINKNDKEKE